MGEIIMPQVIETLNSRETVSKEGKYIYCIIAIDSQEPPIFDTTGIEDGAGELYTISYNDIAAVVSDSPIKRYSFARDNLISHERAIEEVMKIYTVLPVRFGTVAENEQKVRKILQKDYDKFSVLLKDIEGKKELGLKAIFKEDIYGHILDKYEDIKILKEVLQDMSPSKTHRQRMEIGKMVEGALQSEKEIYQKDILSGLLPLAEEVKINNNYGELMILNAAFLVRKHRERKFDKIIQHLDERYGDIIKFKYVGTLPPFNFVNLTISTGEY